MLDESFLLWFANEYRKEILLVFVGALGSTGLAVLLSLLRRKQEQ